MMLEKRYSGIQKNETYIKGNQGDLFYKAIHIFSFTKRFGYEDEYTLNILVKNVYIS